MPWQLLLYLGSAFVLTVSLLAIAILHSRVERLLIREAGHVLGPVLASAGSLLIPFVGHSALGACGSLAFVAVSDILTGAGSALLLISWGVSFSRLEDDQLLLESCAAFVLGVAMYALLTLVMPVVHSVLVILLPLASAAFCRKANCLIGEERACYLPWKTKGHSAGGGVLRVAVGTVLFGFAAGITRDLQPMPAASDPTSEYALTICITTTVVVLTFYGLTRAKEPFDINALFRPTLIIMLLGILFMPLFYSTSLAPAALVKSGYTCFELLVWIVLARFCRCQRISPVFAYGIGRCMVAGSGVLGGIAALLLAPIVQETGTQAAFVYAVLAIALVVLCNSVMTTENFSSLWAPADDKPKKASFEQRCNVLFDHYELSPRQREIAFLIACGHDANYIAEKLYISKGTINSHRMRIYKKLDVHSRQELLDLVPSVDDLDQAAAPKQS